MKLETFILFLIIVAINCLDETNDADLNAPQLIEKYGYGVEVHYVITEDGYILQMHRIVAKNGTVSNGEVAYLQHGLMSSSIDWIIAGPDKSLGYLLADQGYDVWLGNNRGNTYSRNNTSLSPNSAEFWDFTWHEIGTRDLPAMIDYILLITGKEQLFYVGHSQGTTCFYVMASVLPQYNSKIKAQVSLAPIAFMSNAISPFLTLLSPIVDQLNVLGALIGWNEFFPSTSLTSTLNQIVCATDGLTQPLCTNIMFLMAGFDQEQTNTTLVPIILAHDPAGSSRGQLVHYAQLYNSHQFRQYDHGLIENLLVYNQMFPPDYNLDNITSPVHILYSTSDWFSAAADVESLSNALPNLKEKYLVPYSKWNHYDYLFGIDVKTLVNLKVINIMALYL